jgi:hypothetical protein
MRAEISSQQSLQHWTHQKLCAIPAATDFFEKSSRRQQTHALVIAVRELVVVIFVVFMGVSFSEVQSVF